ERLAGVPPAAPGFFQPRAAGALGAVVGESPRGPEPGPDDLSPAAAAPARADRASPRDAALPGDGRRLADGPVLPPGGPPAAAAGAGDPGGSPRGLSPAQTV